MPYRTHECKQCKYSIVLWASTQNLSGEASAFCPKCGKKATFSSAIHEGKPHMPKQVAVGILTSAIRNACEDHAFGDSEISWYNGDQTKPIAEGYSSRSVSSINFSETKEYAATDFDDCRDMMFLGKRGQVTRNDNQLQHGD